MYSFVICFVALIASYFIYGKIVERVAGVDGNTETPVHRLEDGVDYMPMPKWRLYLIHFLNIAGLGPILGVIQGVLFGPAAFLWITLGTIFVGAVHDFFSGFLSLRNDGSTMPQIISKYLGRGTQKFIAVVTIITGVLVAATFSTGSAALLANITGVSVAVWVLIIFIYFVIATLVPIDQIIGRVYPVFGILFIVMIVMMMVGLFINPNYPIPEFTTSNLVLSDKPIFPYIFVTIACGAISGFHASQSPIVARCMKTEEDARPVFFGAMVLEGLVALCWAAIALAFLHANPHLAATFASTPTVAAHDMAKELVGPIGLIIVIIGIVICPITTGDTSLRSSRITIADELNISQEKALSRFKIAAPLFIAGYALTFVDFTIVWRYVAWAQLLIGTAVLLAATSYLMKKKKNYLITLLPGILCLLITIGYILQAPEGLNLPAATSNIIALIATVVITAIFIKKYKKRE